jgi:acetylglutamate kinase
VSARVYKVGGPALEEPDLVSALAAEVRRAGGAVVLVHGGGRQVERALLAQGAESRFVEGRRATTPEAMRAVEMVLSGVVNKELAASLTAAGIPAVGLSGRDGALLRARVLPGLGRVGRPERVDPTPLRALLAAGFVPVVSPVSAGPSGQALNVNADEAALAIASALDARSLVYLSDVDGVRLGDEAVAVLREDAAERGIADGSIAGGMVMKVRTALAACAAGIPEVVIAGRARLVGGFAGTTLQLAGVVA